MRAGFDTVLVTGGGQRLGLELVQQCLAMGFRAVALYHSHHAPLTRFLRKAPDLAGRVECLRADLRHDATGLIPSLLDRGHKLRGLVNSAALFSQGDLCDDTHFKELLTLNTLIPLTLSREFISHAKKGWIINITDANIRPINLRWQNYRVSKLFLQELTGQLAVLGAPHVRVNAIAPGAMLPSRHMSKKEFRDLRHLIPLGRTNDLHSLRMAFAYLADDANCTGQTIYCDGGWHLGTGRPRSG